MAMIPYHPLRLLVQEAQLIAVAEVSNSSKGRATLVLREVLKGEPREAVQISFFPGTLCPLQPNYEPSSTVIVFLERALDEEPWSTVGHAYGELKVSPEEESVVLSRIRELLEIVNLNPVDRPRHVLEWLLRCAEGEATRRDALHELKAQPDEFLAPDDPLYGTFRSALTAEDKVRLREIFLECPTRDFDIALVRVIDEVADGRVMRRYREELSAWLNRFPDYLDWLALRIAEISGREDLKPLASSLEGATLAARQALNTFVGAFRRR